LNDSFSLINSSGVFRGIASIVSLAISHIAQLFYAQRTAIVTIPLWQRDPSGLQPVQQK
jgi:hypothetical protein